MRSRLARPLVTLTLLAAAPVGGAQTGNVLVVGNAGSGAPFTTIQSAIDAADDGDLVLVKSNSTNTPITIDGKSITVMSDNAIGHPCVGTAQSPPYLLRVSNVARGQSVVVRGLRFGIDPEVSASQALRVENAAGVVWLEEGAVDSARSAIELDSCAAAVLVDYTVSFASTVLPAAGPDGVSLAASSMHAYGCFLRGGNGFDATAIRPATPGGSCVSLDASHALLVGTKLYGGSGGDSHIEYQPSFQCHPGADGGAALALLDAACSAQRIGGSLDFGSGGFGVPGVCAPGVDAPLISNPSGAPVLALEAPPRAMLSGKGPIREGGALFLTLFGEPGDWVVLGFSLSPQPLALWPLGGLELGAPWTLFGLGSMSPGGGLLASFVIADLGAGVDWVPLFVQAAHVSPSADVELGPPGAFALLDAAY